MACRIFVINETNNNNNNNGLMRTVVANVCQKAKANNKRKKNTIQERSRSRSRSMQQQQRQQHHHQGGNKLFAKIEQFPSDSTLRIGIGTAVIGIGDIKNKVRAPSSIRQTHNE